MAFIDVALSGEREMPQYRRRRNVPMDGDAAPEAQVVVTMSGLVVESLIREIGRVMLGRDSGI